MNEWNYDTDKWFVIALLGTLLIGLGSITLIAIFGK